MIKFLWNSIWHKGNLIPKILLLFGVVYLAALTLGNLSNPILDEYGFRQTQTAITSYYFIQDGYKLAYETPVVGYPWSIPFEFPIYQALVSFSVKVFSIPLTEAGRLLSLIFFLLTVFLLVRILKILNFSKNMAYVAAAVLVTSPLYLFYSGTFLIEAAALFFAIAFLYFLILLSLDTRNWNIKNISFLGIFLTLGLLQKLTTIFPLLMLSPFILFFALGKENILVLLRRPNTYIALLVGFILPILVCGSWIHFTDQIKLENVIGSALTSGQLRDWNFGSLKQRVSGALWLDTLYVRNILSSPFGWIGGLLVILGLIFANKKFKFILLICLALGLAPLLIFTNLHIVHKYYQFANLLFYLIAIVISIQALIEYIPLKYRLITFNVFAILLIISNLLSFHADYYKRKTTQINLDNSELLRVAAYIKAHTPQDRPIIIYGLDWSSELPFYSERRALALPWGRWDMEALENPKKFLGNLSPSAVILCGVYGQKEFNEISKTYKILSKSTIDSCTIFLINISEVRVW
jgi:4-amino-4-deoxy-L-arabinose transferase-like glycosyltransferase